MLFKSPAEIRADLDAIYRSFDERIAELEREDALVKAVIKSDGNVLARAADPGEVMLAKVEAEKLIAKHGSSAWGWAHIATKEKIANLLRWFNGALDDHKQLEKRSARWISQNCRPAYAGAPIGTPIAPHATSGPAPADAADVALRRRQDLH